ncbi:LIC11299 family lipoprotein [Leptospira sarikeiensis]|uniref:Lipoprotein n=1 Tax=Leptospira sarikeiensis TaxID=2484943 RepID=A0A4R9KDN1_9LEPT|nr:hypothetical protein [Leptospira sarikeiensis]TGL64055.1 hypothetical protein EHQ64_03415 [Leptospira sarikeiensis]
MKRSVSFKILQVALIPAFVFLLSNCLDSHRERVHMDTGVSVTNLGPHKYQFIAIGKASVPSVEEQDFFKMKKTSCEAAKLQVTQRLDELEADQKHRQFFLEQKAQKYFGDGEYCELTYIYELPQAKKQKEQP